jgi:hypothetical protein
MLSELVITNTKNSPVKAASAEGAIAPSGNFCTHLKGRRFLPEMAYSTLDPTDNCFPVNA